MPLFNCKFPANAELFLENLVIFASFELVPDAYVDMYVEYPESEPYSQKFAKTHYESIYPLENMPTDFLFSQVYLFLIATFLITLLCHNKLLCASRLKQRLHL